MEAVLDFLLHFDAHLLKLVVRHGVWIYGLLFLIVFLETGVVVTPFLPGDSLLFAAGSVAAVGGIDLGLTWLLLAVAAILGDTVNYWIGHRVGPRAFSADGRFLKRRYLERTERFYEKHGGTTIVLARFVPIVRTFAPFVAGVGSMRYRRFLAYNVGGGVVWTGLFLGAGFAFGNVPVVKENFKIVIVAIVVVSVIPMVVEWLRARSAGRRA
nr:DedA family protein [Actinomycetales bacterium]